MFNFRTIDCMTVGIFVTSIGVTVIGTGVATITRIAIGARRTSSSSVARR